MSKRKIPNFKVYNYDDWMLNCREKSTFCILMNFKINPMLLLLDCVCYYKIHNGILYQDFKLLGDEQSERFKEVGFESESKCNCVDIVKDIIDAIDCDRPVVISGDFFYDPIRKDVYQKKHGYHFILIFGYDTQNKVFNVVNHDHENNFRFKEYIMTFDEISMCYKGYLDFVEHQHIPSFFSYTKTKEYGYFPDFYYQDKNFKTLIENINECKKGVDYLDEYILTFEEALNNDQIFEEKFDLLYESIRQVNLDILKRNFGETHLFRGHPFINENLMIISNNWKLIKAYFDKYKLLPKKFPISKFEKCIERLKEISRLEQMNNLEIERIGKHFLYGGSQIDETRT